MFTNPFWFTFISANKSRVFFFNLPTKTMLSESWMWNANNQLFVLNSHLRIRQMFKEPGRLKATKKKKQNERWNVGQSKINYSIKQNFFVENPEKVIWRKEWNEEKDIWLNPNFNNSCAFASLYTRTVLHFQI